MKQFIRRETDRRVESRDAIVYDVLENDRVCRVRVQGSTELVVAWYPENWRKVPEWLRVGNCVRVAHVGGIRGRVEVMGNGLRLPPNVVVSVPIGPDAIIEGMGIRAVGDGTMTAIVEEGSYRINGVTYELSPGSMVMGVAPIQVMSADTTTVMGEAGQVISFAAAPSVGWFRYDPVVVGIDGVIDVVTGTAWQWPGYPTFSGEPTIPNVPGGHTQVGFVLVHGGATEITQEMIGRYFEAPHPAEIVTTASTVGSKWAGEDDYKIRWNNVDEPLHIDNSDVLFMRRDVTFSILDQYENPASYFSTGVINIVQFRVVPREEGTIDPTMGTLSHVLTGSTQAGGSALVYDLGLGYQTTLQIVRPYQWVYSSGNYTQGNATDYSPLIEISLLSGKYPLKSYTLIQYLNSAGVMMPVP